MPSLIEKSACDGLLPVIAGGITLSEAAAARITAVAAFSGKNQSCAAALRALGLDWPEPGRAVTKGNAACLWTGRDQAFVIGADAGGLADSAALTDQSDGWARLMLEGVGAEAALTRLVPLDLRAPAFPVGAVARSGLNHMMMVLHRAGPATFEIMVFRSMAATAIHEIGTAMAALAARAAR